MHIPEHDLRLPWIIAVATLAATLGDNIGFALGYYGGRRMLDRYQAAFKIRDTTLARGEDLFARYGAVTIFFARFVFGMRIIAGPLAGVLRMPWRKFTGFQFSGGGPVGDGDFCRGLFVWTALGTVGEGYKTIRSVSRDCGVLGWQCTCGGEAARKS